MIGLGSFRITLVAYVTRGTRRKHLQANPPFFYKASSSGWSEIPNTLVIHSDLDQLAIGHFVWHHGKWGRWEQPFNFYHSVHLFFFLIDDLGPGKYLFYRLLKVFFVTRTLQHSGYLRQTNILCFVLFYLSSVNSSLKTQMRMNEESGIEPL